MKNVIIGMVLLMVLISACSGNSQVAAPPTSPTQPTYPIKPEAATQTSKPTVAPGTLLPTATWTVTASPTRFVIPTSTVTSTPYVVGPNNFPKTINPLTGLFVSDINSLDRRPMAVKVQLYPRGQRPVYGVSLADIVYDYYQNDGLTRLNAVFYGADASQIGPIRSARLFDESVIRMYKALFAFGGAAEYVLNRLYNADFADRLITEGNRNCPPMCRLDPNGFNFLFTSTPEMTLLALRKGIPNKRQNLNGMTFSSQPPGSAEIANQVSTRYSISSYNRWEYDPASKRYLRFQDAQENANGQGEALSPLVDGLTNQQIAADNVIALFLPHRSADVIGNRRAIDVRMEGSGDAYAFRDGQGYKIRWNRPSKDAVPILTFEDGQPYPLKPGNTWFQVIGITSEVENPGDGAWQFSSRLP